MMLHNCKKEADPRRLDLKLQTINQLEHQLNACINQLDILDLSLEKRLQTLAQDCPTIRPYALLEASSYVEQFRRYKESWDNLSQTYCELRERTVRQVNGQRAKFPSVNLVRLWEEMATETLDDDACYPLIFLNIDLIRSSRIIIDLFQANLIKFLGQRIQDLDQDAWEYTQTIVAIVEAVEQIAIQRYEESAPRGDD